jgi:mannose-6-phosphate isomerase-like protein (cupin superfamily)
MPDMERRSFFGLAIAALPLHLFASSLQTAASITGAFAAANRDRYANDPSDSSVLQFSTVDIQAAFFVMEHNTHNKGGPPRHLHHDDDEWFYVIEGEYLIEIASQRHRLTSGDSIVGPRKVPHAWAFVGNTPGWLLRAYAPGGKMGAFFAERRKRGRDTYYPTDAALYRTWGMELLGPPLLID